MSYNKIIIWPDRKNINKILRLKPDILLYSQEELEKLQTGKLELLEIFNEKEKKIGLASRKATHSLHLIDRVAHVFIFNSKGELFLQQRSKEKDVYPGYFAPSASGHLDLNEIPKTAAARELEEELGIKATSEDLKELGSFKCFTEIMNEFIYVYMYITDAPVKINETEISNAKFYSIKELKQLDKKIFIPALKKELTLYLEKMLKNFPSST